VVGARERRGLRRRAAPSGRGFWRTFLRGLDAGWGRAENETTETREKTMSLHKDDILEALGLQKREGFGEWIGPVMIGFGVGAVVGAAVALLVAPSAGAELREGILDRGRRVVHRGREKLDEVIGEGGRPEPRH
jgi:hypothetical protein